MHPNIFVYESAKANARMMAAATVLAEQYGMAEQLQALNVSHRDDDTERLEQLRAIANFLEALAAVESASLDDVLSIEGLSKTSIAAIRKHFGVTDGNSE